MPSAVTEKPLHVRLPVELSTQLEALNKATGRTKSFLTVEALREITHQTLRSAQGERFLRLSEQYCLLPIPIKYSPCTRGRAGFTLCKRQLAI